MAGFAISAQVQLAAPTNVAQIARQIQTQLSGISANININVIENAQSNISTLN